MYLFFCMNYQTNDFFYIYEYMKDLNMKIDIVYPMSPILTHFGIGLADRNRDKEKSKRSQKEVPDRPKKSLNNTSMRIGHKDHHQKM